MEWNGVRFSFCFWMQRSMWAGWLLFVVVVRMMMILQNQLQGTINRIPSSVLRRKKKTLSYASGNMVNKGSVCCCDSFLRKANYLLKRKDSCRYHLGGSFNKCVLSTPPQEQRREPRFCDLVTVLVHLGTAQKTRTRSRVHVRTPVVKWM